MEQRDIKRAIQKATVHSVLEITVAFSPFFNEQKLTAKVVGIKPNQDRIVEFEGDLGVQTIPFDPQMEHLITSVRVMTDSPLFVPIRKQNRDTIDHNATTIYLDGGALECGSAAAAIVAYVKTDGKPDVLASFSRYFPRATNNIGEGAALVAAFRFAHRLFEAGHEHVNIVMDCEIFYDALIEGRSMSKPWLKNLLHDAQVLFARRPDRFTILNMYRRWGNPADDHVKLAMQTAKGTVQAGSPDYDLFPEPPSLPPPRIQSHRPVVAHAPDLSYNMMNPPDTLAGYAAMRRFRVRCSVPDNSVDLWARVVRHLLKRFLDAPAESKEKELMRFLLLPTWFLPKSASTRRVLNHLQRGEPFHTTTEGNRRDRPRSTNNHRLSEAIERLAGDRKMRSANRLLSAAADAPDVSHEEKVAGMQRKILPGDFTSSIPQQTVPMINALEVLTALGKCSRQAANAIDAWSRTLLQQAIDFDNEIATMIGELLHHILCAQHSPFMRQVLCLSRGVGLPKPDGGGIRPICVSSVFLKMLGAVVSVRDGTLPSHSQYAVGIQDGARRIVHKVKEYIRRNHEAGAVVRMDLSNAYGTAQRKSLESIIKNTDASMQQYFRLVYGSSTTIAVYGPDDTSFIPIGEGVKQGDATSSLLFCLVADIALNEINSKLAEQEIAAEVYMYMDDLTICVDIAHADTVATIATNAFASIGLMVNEAKSKILTSAPGARSLPVCSHEEEFIILGANVALSSASYEAFIERLLQRQANYFDLLQRTRLHDQVRATLLRICGFPRIHYHCTTTPPEFMREVARFFDEQVKRAAELIVDATGETKIPRHMIHDDAGLGAPDYSTNLELLFNTYRTMALDDDLRSPCLSLTTSDQNSTTARAQVDSQWMFYEANNYLTPAQFSTAMAIRLNVLPRRLQLVNTKCNCGYTYDADDCKTVNHVLTCDMSTKVTHSTRHNYVRDEMIRVARLFGITTTKEPTCFTYNCGRAKRPDALFHTQPCNLATDVSLVSTMPAPEAISKKEKEKDTIHKDAVAQGGAIFVPFVMATRGLLGEKGEQFMRQLAHAVQPAMHRAFIRLLRHAVSVAAARGRADALLTAAQQHRW